jgi:hypothetical protein
MRQNPKCAAAMGHGKFDKNKMLFSESQLLRAFALLIVALMSSCAATGPITGKGYSLPDPCYDAEMYAVRNGDHLTPYQVGLLCDCQPFIGMSEQDFYSVWYHGGREVRGTTLFGQPYRTIIGTSYSVTFIDGRVADFVGY